MARSPAASSPSTASRSRRCRCSRSTCRCPEKWRHDLAVLALRGSVSAGKFAWTGPPDAPTKFSGSGAFTRFGIAASEALPGAASVSGNFTFDETRGDLKLDSRDMRVSLPRVFADKLLFDNASGRVGWIARRRRACASRSTTCASPRRTPRARPAAAGARAPQGPGVDRAQGAARARRRAEPVPLPAADARQPRARLAALGDQAGHRDRHPHGARRAISPTFRSPIAKTGQFLVTFKATDATVDYADGLARRSPTSTPTSSSRAPACRSTRAAAGCSARRSGR